MGSLNTIRAQWDRIAAVVFVSAGLIALILGYYGVSGTEFVAAQLPYLISAGLVGMFLLGLGATLWLSSDLRDEWCKLEETGATLQRLEEALEAAASRTPVTPENGKGRRPVAARRTPKASA